MSFASACKSIISVLKELKTLIWGNSLYRLATLLILSGIGLAGGVSILQLFGVIVVNYLNEKTGKPLAPEDIAAAAGSAVLLGLGLILSGVVLWIWAYRRDEQIRALEKGSPYFRLVALQGNNFVRSGNDNGEANSAFTADANFNLLVGLEPVTITRIDSYYFADGCVCLSTRSQFWSRKNELPVSIEGSLVEPWRLEPDTVTPLGMRMNLRPYWLSRSAADCDYGELTIQLHYVSRKGIAEKIASYFSFRPGGELIEIPAISPPPRMSNREVDVAIEQGRISQDDGKFLKEYREPLRYAAMCAREGDEKTALLSGVDVARVKRLSHLMYEHGDVVSVQSN